MTSPNRSRRAVMAATLPVALAAAAVLAGVGSEAQAQAGRDIRIAHVYSRTGPAP